MDSNPSIPKFFSGEILKLLSRLEKSGQQRLNNVAQVHLVLAGGNLVLRKNFGLHQNYKLANAWTQTWPTKYFKEQTKLKNYCLFN